MIAFMKYVLFFLLLGCISVNAQNSKSDVSIPPVKHIKAYATVINGDTLPMVYLKPAWVIEKRVFKNQFQAWKYGRLVKNVKVTYPYAKIAADRLTALNQGMKDLKSERDRKKYFKLVENYLTNEFEEQLKKLSRKDGQILVKLIHRQTGETTFNLIKELKSGWKAFWSNNTARLFDINLKTQYAPYEVNEDYLIETILERAFANGRLVKQESANPVDYDKLSDYWYEKANKKQQ